MTNIDKHIQSILKKISELNSLDEKINTIASYTKLITGARRCSLFIFHRDESKLISIYNDGIEGNIVLQSNIGLVGYAFHKKKSILENDTVNNPLFYKSVDKRFDFTTRSILAVPIVDKNGNSLGVIELLNKKIGFTQDDQAHIEALILSISSLLISQNVIPGDTISKPLSQLAELQKKISTYLEDKHLYLMEDGYAYYKILDMKREYYIAADTCYQLTDTSTPINLYYYTNNQNNTEEFLPFKISAMLDNTKGKLLISETNNKENFIHYPLEKET